MSPAARRCTRRLNNYYYYGTTTTTPSPRRVSDYCGPSTTTNAAAAAAVATTLHSPLFTTRGCIYTLLRDSLLFSRVVLLLFCVLMTHIVYTHYTYRHTHTHIRKNMYTLCINTHTQKRFIKISGNLLLIDYYNRTMYCQTTTASLKCMGGKRKNIEKKNEI